MGMDLVTLMALNGAVLAGAATGTVSFRWLFDRFAKASIFPPWHEPCLKRRSSKIALVSPFFEPRHVLDRPGDLDGGAFSVFVLGRFETGACRLGFLDDFFCYLLTLSDGLFGGFFGSFAGFRRGFGCLLARLFRSGFGF